MMSSTIALYVDSVAAQMASSPLCITSTAKPSATSPRRSASARPSSSSTTSTRIGPAASPFSAGSQVAGPTVRTMPPVDSSSHSALVVDEDLVSGWRVAEGLRDAGFTAVWVTSQAVAAAQLSTASYDVVLVSLSLP